MEVTKMNFSAGQVDKLISFMLGAEAECDILFEGILIQGRFCRKYKILLSTMDSGSEQGIFKMAKNLFNAMVVSGGLPFAIRRNLKDPPIEYSLAEKQ